MVDEDRELFLKGRRAELNGIGIRNARARGVRLGRPRVVPDVDKIACLRAEGRSWRSISRELGVAAATAKNRWNALKNPFIGGDS